MRLGRELTRKGHNVSVATSFRPMDQRSQEKDVKVFEVKPFVSIYKIPHTLSFPVSRIREITKSQEIDIIHAINDHSTNVAVASLTSKATGIPFVYTIQGPGTRTGHLLVDTTVATYDLTFERWIAQQARRIILLSKSLHSTAEKLKVSESKIVVVPSGIDCEFFDRDRPEVKEKVFKIKEELGINDKVVIGFAGRLVPAKGLNYLFSALKQIEDEASNVVVLIVGDGAQKSELEMQAKDLKVRTIFAGWQRDMLPYYALMDVFVLPSLFEGLPNVVLEAMAMKTAVVATNVGGNPDVLANGQNGFLVPPRDVSKLAFALKKLVKAEDLRVEMGMENRRKVEKDYQWNTAVEKIEKVYSEVAHFS